MEDINPPKNASYWKRRCKRVETENNREALTSSMNVNDELRIENTELQAEVNKWKHNSQYFADELAERLSKITELQAEIQKLEDSLKFKDGEYQEMRELSYKFEQAFAVTEAELVRAQPVLDAAKEYAHWHTYEYSEIDDKDLAYDNLLEAVKAREEAKCAD